MTKKPKVVKLKDGTEFIVEKGYTMPAMKYHLSRWMDLISNMEVGESVVMGHKETLNCQTCGRNFGYKMTIRKLESGKARIWLLAKLKEKKND